MTCRDLTEFLMDYLDGALPFETRAVFDQHLAVCRECRDYLRSYKTTVHLERSAYRNPEAHVAEPPPAELVTAILASWRAELPSRPPRIPLQNDSNPPLA